MGEVVVLDLVTRLDVPPDRILEAALGQLESVVIAGFKKDGSEHFASSVADGGDALWLLERCKKRLLEMADKLTEAADER